MSVFAQKEMCDYQRSSEHVVTRRGSTGRSTVPYRCTIDVRTHTGPSGVPTGPPGPRRDPTDPRRTAGGPQLLLASAVAMVGLGFVISILGSAPAILVRMADDFPVFMTTTVG